MMTFSLHALQANPEICQIKRAKFNFAYLVWKCNGSSMHIAIKSWRRQKSLSFGMAFNGQFSIESIYQTTFNNSRTSPITTIIRVTLLLGVCYLCLHLVQVHLYTIYQKSPSQVHCFRLLLYRPLVLIPVHSFFSVSPVLSVSLYLYHSLSLLLTPPFFSSEYITAIKKSNK